MTEIDCGEITIITFADKIAEIVIPVSKPSISAVELVRVMTMNNISAARIIRIQTAKESPPPRGLTK